MASNPIPRNVPVLLSRDPGRGGCVEVVLMVFRKDGAGAWDRIYIHSFEDVSREDLGDLAKVAAKNKEDPAAAGNPLRLQPGDYAAVVAETFFGGGNGLCGFELSVDGSVRVDRMDTDIGPDAMHFERDEFTFTIA